MAKIKQKTTSVVDLQPLCSSQTQDDIKVFEIPPSPDDNTGAGPSSSRRKASSPQAGPGPSSSAAQRRRLQKDGKGRVEHVQFQLIELSDSDEDVLLRARRGKAVVNAGSPVGRAPGIIPGVPPPVPQLDQRGPEQIPIPPSPSPPPAPPKEATPLDSTLDQLSAIFGDIDTTYARTVVDGLLSKNTAAHLLLDEAMEIIFAQPMGYPKKSKRKRDEEKPSREENQKVRKVRGGVDYESRDRFKAGGRAYDELSIATLSADFPLVPIPHLKKDFSSTHLFVPTYMSVLKQSALSVKPYREKKVPTLLKGKERREKCPEWEEENEWLRERLSEMESDRARAEAEALDQLQLEESGEGIECGCCFGLVRFERCGQCDEGHLFCTDCIEGHAKNQIGSQIVEIDCMDTSGCKAMFLASELRRLLPQKLVDLWERLQQQKHIAAAGLEGLESCPFCDYALVIENQAEKLFDCQGCGVVSCRSCKKVDHLPKSCEEMMADDKLNHRHSVEEAMTRRLIRTCPNPKCGRPTIKESGCNKMSCSACRTLFCYVCNAVISNEAYRHFDQDPADYGRPRDTAKCILWDKLEYRTERELQEAREKAKEELRAKGVAVDESLDVALPDRSPSATYGVPGLGPQLWQNFGNAFAQAVRPPAPAPRRPPAPPVQREEPPPFYGAGAAHYAGLPPRPAAQVRVNWRPTLPPRP